MRGVVRLGREAEAPDAVVLTVQPTGLEDREVHRLLGREGIGGEAEEAAPALLTVTTNDSVNYVGGNFTKSVGTALTDSLRASVLEEYLGKIYVGFTTIHDGIADAADLVARLAAGDASGYHDARQAEGARTIALSEGMRKTILVPRPGRGLLIRTALGLVSALPPLQRRAARRR